MHPKNTSNSTPPMETTQKPFTFPKCWNDDERMSVIMAPFRPRHVNPLNYDNKMQFWQNLIMEYCEHKGEPTFCLQELRFSFKRDALLPHCLDTVLDVLYNAGKIQVLETYEINTGNAWAPWIVSNFVKRPLHWGWQKVKSQIGFENKNNEHIKYIHLDVMNNLSNKFQVQVLEKKQGTVLHYDELKAIAMAAMTITDECLKLVLRELHLKQKIGIEYHTTSTGHEMHLIKIPSKGDGNIAITELDRATHNLKMAQKSLTKQLDDLDAQICQNKELATKYLMEQKRHMAKLCLRRMHIMEKNYEKRMLALQNIEQMLDSVCNAQSHGHILDAYKIGSEALKNALDKSGLQYDNVDEVIADARDTIERQKELEDTIANGNLGDTMTDVDMADLENELEAMCQQNAHEAAIKPKATPIKKANSLNNNTNTGMPSITISDTELLDMLDRLEVADETLKTEVSDGESVRVAATALP